MSSSVFVFAFEDARITFVASILLAAGVKAAEIVAFSS